ncbi:MAG: DEAD/DEAH box helicase family protein [Saprospiraceae bacterium]|nr:DEAD/DEAH box helicase family protein [Saprospiraceae bacterium]
MKTFPAHTAFKYPWRKYQQRVLHELEDHLEDAHLHIVAPPGSGKTVLGLEVARRLNQPTLILAPTIAIRNQWIQRFTELFLQTNSTPEWISRDIRQPKFMTVVTYQGLHAACNNFGVVEEDGEEEAEAQPLEPDPAFSNFEKIIQGLQAQDIKTIVVDEAHHLKRDWWHTLSKIKARIEPVIVGLTATPPYDVSATEWQRYLDLNGPVDAEIAVPELVIEGDLCPHQDYVYFSKPTKNEHQRIGAYRDNMRDLFQAIQSDDVLITAIEQHPIWQDPNAHLDWIYTNLPHYSACLIFLKAVGRVIPESHLEVIGDKDFQIPKLDYSWLETLLDFYLYKEKEHFNAFEEHKEQLENRLRRYGAIERKQINFVHNHKVTSFLKSSISKLDSINRIVEFEYQQLGSDLRLVILSDYIRKEFLVESTSNELELNKIGIIPIFEQLRRANSNKKKLGVLTGSIIILPQTALSAFNIKAAAQNLGTVPFGPVPYDADYVIIRPSEQMKHHIVHLVTQIFQEGHIEVLIGTKSLLGEGWDAPAINTLILATFVGSFVLSNQMRGRAIRTQKGNATKTANIWHLVCVDPTSPFGGDDLELLHRRFRSFVGVSFKEESGIENGMDRLAIPPAIHQTAVLTAKNEEMLEAAGDRASLQRRWDNALEKGVTLVEELKIPFPEERGYKTVKALYYFKTIRNLIATLISGLISFGTEAINELLRVVGKVKSAKELLIAIAVFGAIGFLYFGRLTYKTLRLYLKYRDISKDVQHIGEALLQALIKAGVIQGHSVGLKVVTSISEQGMIYAHLEGGNTFEKSSFIAALKEIVDPISNPRYVIIRKSTFLQFIDQRDYHAVPEVLGRNKAIAEFFSEQWEKTVGPCELIFTRSVEGRKLLLKSRIQSLSAQFEPVSQHASIWR